MHIYKLTLQDGSTADWADSAYKGGAVIRAASEKDARLIADISFGVAKPVKLGAKTTAGSWLEETSVRCEILKGSKFPDEGKRVVLDPKEWAMEIHFAPAK